MTGVQTCALPIWIILTADAHSADAVVFFYEGAAELARAAGYGSSVLLTAAGDVERPL